ncbi:DUF2691 family protein [Haloimpatiens sp. FM7330]|uniref:DUF2691 family protein n=1 Tax=Haloimpatiens sp. FM7330 TaxID=3298610 RepID=UPI003633878D
MTGITFKLKNKYNNFLFKIFYNINITNFVWSIEDSEIIYKGKNNKLNMSIFNKNMMSGLDFFKCIETEKYYLIYANIKAFNNKTQIINIDTYDDFVKSDCEIALFCTDTVYIELYCKNKNILDGIIKNCTRFNFHGLKILTQGKDNRTRFSI